VDESINENAREGWEMKKGPGLPRTGSMQKKRKEGKKKKKKEKKENRGEPSTPEARRRRWRAEKRPEKLHEK